MKIKDGFILRESEGSFFVIAVGKRSTEFKKMIVLNESGAFLFNKLKNDITKEELVESLLNEYEIDKQTATKHVEEFINSLTSGGLLE